MTTPMKIDFVSDVSCPWCVIGLNSLQEALTSIGPEIAAELHFQPFELNPDMPPEGQDIGEHLSEKYGSTPEQREQSGNMIRERGAKGGFVFNMDKRSRIYNTFDAHRLLHWAELEGKQIALKRALFDAYFTEGKNPGDHHVLIALAESVGLDSNKAREILSSDTFAKEVRAQERRYLDSGIHSVPAVIINDRFLIQGGQPTEEFERVLREIAATV
ncbi:DsbA family oxidoreductase [Glaciimonas immobilis]|uniref:Putative DsbA family dithiol-disulfide isomerase n=1 Tax=Glaciimonas immobilis TaxID=728004 RepID=A0A840RX74_9BURK|nr:DsbA family oxidoreductase [Glaciimonas immobilis]KAF3996396.1 DsbA family oxidoreductase [Glaciimonas immobilis]MBB5201274.1 putative DsbA family dithiol-disulfide isomerase [Glaciimonas immobilis]